ncbi:MAG: DinB family protein, partial [Pseudomonadota bacterium]
MPLDLPAVPDAATILETLRRVRFASETLAKPLSPEDCMLQSMEDASPVKWNLAHTTWFFETFILLPYSPGYEEFHPDFGYLFNSYYNRVGVMHPRPIRGLVSRPSLEDVKAYRMHVNEALMRFVEKADAETLENVSLLLATGCAHEQQHQELLLTDLQHAMSVNPLKPAVYKEDDCGESAATALEWVRQPGGLVEIGATGKGFAFDNEGPRHKTHLLPYFLANRLVTNGDYLGFMEDGGYDNPDHWFSDGWDIVCRENWNAPLYWRKKDGAWRQ